MPKPASYHSKESPRSAPMRLTRPAIAVSGSRPNARTVRSSSLSAGPIPRALGPGSGRCCSAIVAEFKYLTWTDENLLRQVVYEVLREDKPAAEVRRPVPSPKADLPKRHRSSSSDLSDFPCRTFQLGGKFGVGRSGGIEKTSLISLTSEDRRAATYFATVTFLVRDVISRSSGYPNQCRLLYLAPKESS